MTRRKIPENKKNQAARKGREQMSWQYCLLTLGCGAILVVGFFFAAQQHFSSIDFGIKNSKLRQQIENLEADKRRFQLAKEIALSPDEIRKVAQKLGFREMLPNSAEVARPLNDPKEKSKASSSEKPKQNISEENAELAKDDAKPKKEVKKEDRKSSEVKGKSKPQIAGK